MSIPSSRALVAASPRQLAGRAATSRGRGAPRAGSHPGRRRPPRPARRRGPAACSRGGRGHDLDAGSSTGRRPPSARRRSPGRPAGRPTRLPRCGRLPSRRRPARRPTGHDAGLPQAEGHRLPGRAVVGRPRGPAARSSREACTAGSCHGGGGEDERRVGAVAGGHPPQPRAGPAPRGCRRRRGRRGTRRRRRSSAPAGTAPTARCPGSSEWCSRSGLVRTYARVLADPAPLVRGRVAVVRRRPKPRQRQLLQTGQLVVRRAPWWGRGRGRSPPARSGRRPPSTRSESDGEEVAERLARRRAGRQDDVLAPVGGLRRLGLVGPQVGLPAPRRAA